MTLTPFSLKLDLSEIGMKMFFKSYQIAVLDVLFDNPDGLNSRQVWQKTNEAIPNTISRASIINFLNSLVDLEVLEYKEVSGKGGYQRIYWYQYTKKDLAKFLYNEVTNALNTL
jgi:Fe2+ or Zn2+ uptake regulation protein